FNDLANPEIDPNHLWRKELGMHENENKELFAAGKFTIVRKTPDVMMAMRRIVYDNDFPAKDLAGPAWQRWHPTQDSGWTAARDHGFDHQGGPKDEVDWLRYRHIVRPMNGEDPPVGGRKSELITDFMAYNSFWVHGDWRDKIPSPN